MSDVITYFGFRLTCRECQCEILVGPTRDFVEQRTHAHVTGYYSAAPEGSNNFRLVGVSDGSGDTFECLPCHAVKWLRATEGE